MNTQPHGSPPQQGLYDPRFEHDACGIGMLADIQGRKSHKLVTDAIDVLCRLTHRGGAGCESETGDGAGILVQLPHGFFARMAASAGVRLPAPGAYGVAMVFASPETARGKKSLDAFCCIAARKGLTVLWTRRAPVNPACCGKSAAEVRPSIWQVFLARPEEMDAEVFERRLYVLSKIAAREIRGAAHGADRYFYIASISSNTIVYKGMLLPGQLAGFYLDLQDEGVESAIALVHSRFSTNTFPSWERAHPMRHLIHNGEINTIGGNANWMRARQKAMSSHLFGVEMAEALPVIDENGSDSAMLDDYIRLLVNSGYSLPHAMMLAIPEPWEKNEGMPAEKRAFYAYHNCLAEPWDGPAAVAFTDGVQCGAMLDRNGLRPARYTLTRDGLLVLASETGVLPLPEEVILRKGRLHPGQMLLVDTAAGRIIGDEELKREVSTRQPYGQWLGGNLLSLDDLPAAEKGEDWAGLCEKLQAAPLQSLPQQAAQKRLRTPALSGQGGGAMALPRRQRMFGYTWEDLTFTLRGMAEGGEDPVSSMGTDTPLAVLSKRPQPLYNYFKQLFAQVTNPPIDAIREELVTSASTLFGGEGNLLEPGPANCRMVRHNTPVLSEEDMCRLRGADTTALRSITLPTLFDPRHENGLRQAMDDLFAAADTAIEAGYSNLILSDAAAGAELAPIPALLAVSGLHQHLVRRGTRTRCSLVAEAGDAWESHHFAALVGFGANGVFPHMAYATLRDMAGQNLLAVDAGTACAGFRTAATKSLVKIMSKMGVSTVRSYQGAQMFEALGIGQAVIDRYFTGTTSRIGGLGLGEIAEEAAARHADALRAGADEPLDTGGNYKWRGGGEYHLLGPENIHLLQTACRTGSYKTFQAFSRAVNSRSEQLKNIRGLLRIKKADKPVSIDAVESAESIVRRFKTGAMSYGSISREAHECMAIAMNRLGGKSNTGEGGEDAERFAPNEDGNNRCSAIKQVASGRFGVTVHYLRNAREIQIKMAQGAKPGEGGHLPGQKVYPWIAKSRHSTPGVELISPPPHHDIYSIEDLAQLIHDLKSANPAARISVKLVSEAGVGTVAVGVAKGLADVIVVGGYDGGTGAAPRTSIRHAGLPWELGVAEAHQTLLMNGLRSRVVLETDGKLLTGRDIVVAALLGAEEFAFATAPLVALGCNMMRVCNLDTCPVGIATQNPLLRGRFAGKPEHIENLMLFLAEEVREWMSRIGVRRFEELIGHVELLSQRRTDFTPKAKTVDLSALLYQPKVVDSVGQRHFTRPQDHRLENTMDSAVLLPLCQSAIAHGEKVDFRLPVSNQDRTVGCTLSGEIAAAHGTGGLAEHSIRLRFTGSAGQSFGAFATQGVTIALTGDANDYLGKGLCGGVITVCPPAGAAYVPEENIIVGNVAFFGATGGEGYIRGMAGERFCVRNSGASVVVEGVGDHACEYMTGGTVLLLGPAGRNFAAGMSGGTAYVWNPEGKLPGLCGKANLLLSRPDEKDAETIRAMLQRHVEYTGSTPARRILNEFAAALGNIVKVVPAAYQKVLDALAEAEEKQMPQEERMLFAFNAVTMENPTGKKAQQHG